MFLILHNPLSSNRKSRRKTKKFVRQFKRAKKAFVVRSTLKIDNLLEYLNERPQITDILLLGGDGSINYLINSIDITQIKQNIYLAKSGSGNDFLRSLKQKKSAKATIGQARLDDSKTVQFINGCGLGFDGLVCHYVNNDRKKNKISYFINVYRSLIHYQAKSITVNVDGEETTYQKAYIASIQNGRYFGGGMKAAPKADITDENYYIIIVHNINKLLLQILLMTIYPGWHQKLTRYVTILKGKHIRVQLSDPTYFQADGEVIENVQTIDVKAKSKRQLHAFNKDVIK